MAKQIDTPLRCLWLARTFPAPLNAGDRVYTAALATSFAEAGALVTFLAMANPEAPEARPLSAHNIDWRLVPGAPNSTAIALFSHHPLVAGKFMTRNFIGALRQLLRTQIFDVIVLDQYGMVWAAPIIQRAFAPVKMPLIVHVGHDFETHVTAQIASRFEGDIFRWAALWINALKTARAEQKLVKFSDIVVALSESDREAFQRLSAATMIAVIPPAYDGPRVTHRLITPETPRRIAVVGSYRWIAKQMNLSAFLETGDAILHASKIGLDIVGDCPADFVETWRSRTHATTFHGYVHDLAAFLQDRRMGLIVEATGGGFKLKMLDYVFTRTPVAAIAEGLTGQAEGLKSSLLVAANHADLAHAIAAKIDDIDYLNDLQGGAYAFAADRFSWTANADLLMHAITRAKQAASYQCPREAPPTVTPSPRNIRQ